MRPMLGASAPPSSSAPVIGGLAGAAIGFFVSRPAALALTRYAKMHHPGNGLHRPGLMILGLEVAGALVGAAVGASIGATQ